MDSNNIPSPSTQVNPSSFEDLRKQIGFLQVQVMTLMILLIIFLGSGCLVIFKQASLARKQGMELIQILSDYKEGAAPRMNDFLQRLREYSRNHPDILPIISRYPIVMNPGPDPMTQQTNKAGK
jgi:hypothetical protein